MAKKKKKKDRGGSHAALIQSVVKSFDSGYIGTFTGDDPMDIVEEWIPSTNMAINYIMGDPRYGALPQGRVTEIYGPKSSAKSLLLYDFGKNVQEMGGIFVLIDSESAFSKIYGKYLGINYEKFIYAHIRTIEEVTDFVYQVIETIRDKDPDCPVLIGWDSLAACTTLREDEEDDVEGKSEMGYRARLMSRQMRKISGIISQDNITYVVVNQIRKKIGVMFGKKTTTPGGEALPFTASVRLEVIKTKKLNKQRSGKKVTIGHKVLAYCEKNRVRPPFGETEINIYVDRVNRRYGLDKWSGLADLLAADGIINKTGKNFSIDGETYPVADIGEYWEDVILPAIPEDLYTASTKGVTESEDEEEEDEVS